MSARLLTYECVHSGFDIVINNKDDNQRWHERTELIDSFPEATSWLVKML